MKPKTTQKTIRFTQPLQYRRTGLVCLLFVAILLSPTLIAFSQSEPVSISKKKEANQAEYEIKAAFIYNFLKFIEWPEAKNDTKKSKKEPISIGILGINPFGQAFDPVLDKTIADRPIQIIELESFENFRHKYNSPSKAIKNYQKKYQDKIEQCQIIFICKSEQLFTTQLLDIISEQNILTVSDLPDFAQKGGIVGFVIDREKVRFEINLKSAKREDLQIRSQLLGLARKVYK